MLGSKFETLMKSITENSSYKLNSKGEKLLEEYHKLISDISKVLEPLLENIVHEPKSISKQSAIHIISMINSNEEGNENFELMSRLDIISNGGDSQIQGSTFTFNQDDIILNYLEKI